jgi:hypothetical protein
MIDELLHPEYIGIAVITYYPKWYAGKLRSIKHTDKVRGDLALDFARIATQKGYTIIYVDGKSSQTFRKELGQIPGLIIKKRRSLGRSASKRQAIDYLAKEPGVKVVILTEPEKISLLTDCLSDIVNPILKGDADIVMPKRNDRHFKSSYPFYMYESEIECNSIYNEALRTNGITKVSYPDLDFCFGPRVYRNIPHIVALFKRRYRLQGESILSKLYDPDEYSNTQFFPIINALRKKIKVADVEVPFIYPKIQEENESIGAREDFIIKRNLQRTSILIDLMHFLSFLSRKKASRLKEIKL